MTDRWQTQYNFWASFGVPAYEENSVPDADETSMPYITYQAVTAHFDGDVAVSASIWTRSTSWEQADVIANEIFDALENGGLTIPFDSGLIWYTAGVPFAQAMGDPNDDAVKRKLINVTAHFC